MHERAGRGGKGDVVELNDDEEDLLSAVSEGSAVLEGSWGGKRSNLNVTAYLHQPRQVIADPDSSLDGHELR